jgi:hypothetical protein
MTGREIFVVARGIMSIIRVLFFEETKMTGMGIETCGISRRDSTVPPLSVRTKANCHCLRIEVGRLARPFRNPKFTIIEWINDL